jgi:uncharacterized cupin superfamily protein
MPNPVLLTRTTLPAETTRPDPAKVVEGDPVHTTWNLEDRGGLYCGQWHSTVGAWRVAYDEWEYCFIREGISELTDTAGQTTTYRAGDSFVIRPGFSGIWRVIEPTLKDYVIVLPPGPADQL